ncbi:MAG TPA: MFS transporter [Candidatus Limnocylindria bacterium]|nr:MFS transporter [Candidatus Limnocylindria bacterium]
MSRFGGLREELLGRGILLTYIVCIVTTTTEGTTNLLYPLYLDGYGYALTAIGTLSSLFSVLKLASRVPVGARYRGSTAKGQQIVWLLVFLVSTSGFAFLRGDLGLVIVLTIIHGFAFGALGTINLAVAIDISGGRRAGSVMGWYTAALSAGYALGAFGGGALADRIGIDRALFWLGLTPLVGLVAVWAMPALADAPRAAAVAGSRWWRRGLAAFAAIDGRVWLAFVIVLFLNLLSDSTDTFFPLYGTAIGLPVAVVGGLKGAKSASATVIRFLSGAVFRVLDFRAINFWAVILFAATTFAIPIVSGPQLVPILFAVFLVAGLMRGILRVTSAATVAELRSEGRDIGLASGVYNAGLDIGSIIGPAAGGVLAAALGIPAMFQILAVASLALYFGVALSSSAGRGGLTIGPGRRAKARSAE